MPLLSVVIAIAIGMLAIFACALTLGGHPMRRLNSDQKTETARSRRRAF
jgi:hypothetical protein